MPRKGVLEGHDGKVTLEGGWQGSQCQVLLPSPGSTLQIGPQLQSSESSLQTVA